ncbi:hypothetical protein ACJMK2_037200 [Sinanodonta woodiana]|uniref:Galectin n=1 Tax=Sinanodonta woodiana TaxID=1069815 RepID=A0ABD3WJK8_SINWO
MYIYILPVHKSENYALQSIPFTKNISLRDVSKIVVKGRVLERPTRFSISLQNASSFEPDNVVFVYDARFNFGSDSNIIVCNNRNGGIWGSEERSDYFPFVQKEKFKVKIKLNHSHYEIQVGSHIWTFDHRMPIYDVDTLRIDGNVELYDVQTK